MSTTTSLLPFLIVFIFSISFYVRSQCLHDQRSFLLQFKQDRWFIDNSEGKLQTWNTSTDCCSWGGVTCNFNGHVIALDLNFEGLHGVINDSSTLFSLRHLEYLNLADNDIGDQKMPTKFINFVKLTYLNLGDTGFSGHIPLAISNLTSLTILDLSHNDFLELLDLRKLVHNLSSLTELYLDGVDMSSSKNNEWSCALSSSTPNLRVLSLSSCQLSGPIDSSLQNLRFLSDINLSENILSSSIPESLSNLPNLNALNIHDSGLHGTFPKKIFQIPSLIFLDLSHNDLLYGSLPEFNHNGSLQELYLYHASFYGLIPSSIGNLQHLQSLDLSHNNFIGCVPSSVAELKELTSINLSFNNLSGPIPSLSSLKSLTQMSLSDNKFSGSISSTDWDELANLTSINLGGNFFSGKIPSSLFRWRENLNLSNNQFTGGLPNEFPELSSSQLLLLDLSCNKIQGRLPGWIWEMEILRYLNVSHNFLDEVGNESKGLDCSLFTLDLHANRIQGQIPSLTSSYLDYIDYSNNNFSSVIPEVFFQNLNSTIFIFSNNNFQGSIPHSICNRFLTFLDFSNNSFNGTIPICLFESSPSLEALKLSSNKLTGPIPDKFADNSKLKYLELSKNRLDGKIPRSMSICQSLQFLNLAENQLNDVFPVHLMEISALQVLGLQTNKLHGSIDCVTKNGSWPKLHIINIASNNFSGELPENCLWNWVALMVIQNHSDPLGFSSEYFYNMDAHDMESYTYEVYTTTTKGHEMELSKVFLEFASIDFSCNNFRGNISKVIFELKGLRNLNLSHNALSGEIPASIENLKNLESLDFSRNNLSGEIPTELGSMSFLEYADLSYNQLVGRIPTSTQVQSFPSSYFEGNQRLCGLPLATNCSEPTRPELDGHLTSTSGIEWSFISMEVGFTFGLGVVILPITFSRRWRIFFYRHVERLLFKLLPRLDPRNYMSRKCQVGNLQNLRRQ